MEIVTSPLGKQVHSALKQDGPATATSLSDRLDVTKEGVRKVLSDFVEADVAETASERGPHGAYIYSLTESGDQATLLTTEEMYLRTPCTLTITSEGYERAESNLNGETDVVFIHRLVAVAEHGVEAVKGRHVHHVNGIPWDNRPSNLEVKDPEEHTNEHWHGRPLHKRIADANKRELTEALEQAGYAKAAEVVSENE